MFGFAVRRKDFLVWFFSALVWVGAPAWGHGAAAVFVFLHRAGGRKEESCQQPSAINREPQRGWFMMTLAPVACSNMARLKSPYVLIFLPLCVDPFSPSSPPHFQIPISHFSLYSTACLYLLHHFLVLSSLCFFKWTMVFYHHWIIS